jgi:hypothetical protein
MASTATTDLATASTLLSELKDTLVRRGAARRPSVADEPTCACGQALECCHSAHCPRCGVTLRA